MFFSYQLSAISYQLSASRFQRQRNSRQHLQRVRSGGRSASGAMRAARNVSSKNPPEVSRPLRRCFATGVRKTRTSNRLCTGALITRAEAAIVSTRAGGGIFRA
jgi:hypothetical protein